MSQQTDALQLDVTDLKCPLLFVKVKQFLKKLKPNQQLKVLVCDRSGINDIKRYLDKQHYQYTLSEHSGKVLEFSILKD